MGYGMNRLRENEMGIVLYATSEGKLISSADAPGNTNDVLVPLLLGSMLGWTDDQVSDIGALVYNDQLADERQEQYLVILSAIHREDWREIVRMRDSLEITVRQESHPSNSRRIRRLSDEVILGTAAGLLKGGMRSSRDLGGDLHDIIISRLFREFLRWSDDDISQIGALLAIVDEDESCDAANTPLNARFATIMLAHANDWDKVSYLIEKAKETEPDHLGDQDGSERRMPHGMLMSMLLRLRASLRI